MTKHYQIIVKGKVQGVFYRASAQQKAQELNVRGYAQNQTDGSVFIEAEGEVGALLSFVEWCKQGPPRAVVSSVDVTEGGVEVYSDFLIKR